MEFKFDFEKFLKVNTWIDLGLSLLLIGFIIYFCFRLKFNKIIIAITGILFALLLASWVLTLELATAVIMIVTIAYLFVVSLSHIGAIRTFAGKFQKKNVDKKSIPDKIIDREALYDEIAKAVFACSKQKIGALITFERHDNLKSVTKNGTVINAPVTSELLTTIFYPGTRLHDGAVIIKDNVIYAASVYYTPTTKALTGKYGSRHRAAIGISEISDSVTVVVSEETGRISIAQDGEIEPINPDNFVHELAERMRQGE